MLPKIAVILGPTAVGKTKISVVLAEQIGAEIVSNDSVAVYREMVLGTAKPEPEYRRRVPHHMLDIVSLGKHYSAMHYAADARRAIAEILKRGRVPLVVGGTPLYLRGLLYGLLPGVGEDHELRRQLGAKSNRELMDELASVDPVSAAKIHPNDRKRLARAIEIYRVSGKPKSWHVSRHQAKPRFEALQIGLRRERTDLHDRIDRRVEEMFEHGLVDEVNMLMKQGFEEHILKVAAIGYKETVAFLNREIDREKCVALIKRRTRDFARRQLSLFGANKDISWFSLDGTTDNEVILELGKKITGHFGV